jgi:hypothetical protein
MVDTDVDTITCDFCGVTVESEPGKTAFEAFTSHFEACHAGETHATSQDSTPRERGAGD